MKMIKTEWKIPWHLEEEIQNIQRIMQERNIGIRHVLREANQLADALANEAYEQQQKIRIQSEGLLPRACKGIARLDRIQIPSIRIKTRKICTQG